MYLSGRVFVKLSLNIRLGVCERAMGCFLSSLGGPLNVAQAMLLTQHVLTNERMRPQVVQTASKCSFCEHISWDIKDALCFHPTVVLTTSDWITRVKIPQNVPTELPSSSSMLAFQLILMGRLQRLLDAPVYLNFLTSGLSCWPF